MAKHALLDDAIEMMVDKYNVDPRTGSVRDDLIEWGRVAIERVQSPLRSLWLAYFNLETTHASAAAVKRASEAPLIMVRRGIDRGR